MTLEIKQTKLDPTGNIFEADYVLQYKIAAEMKELDDWFDDWPYDYTKEDSQYFVIPSDGNSVYPTNLGNVGLFTTVIDNTVPGMNHFRAQTLDFTQEVPYKSMCFFISNYFHILFINHSLKHLFLLFVK